MMPGMTRPGATGQRVDVSGQSGGGGGGAGNAVPPDRAQEMLDRARRQPGWMSYGDYTGGMQMSGALQNALDQGWDPARVAQLFEQSKQRQYQDFLRGLPQGYWRGDEWIPDHRRYINGEWVMGPPSGMRRSVGIGGGGHRSAGPMGSRSSRGPTSPWGSGNTMRPGGEQSPALASMFGGGSDEQLMAILQQLGIGG